ncbi:MAG: branched-chain amino acid ABC transporter permease [Rhodocyclaceae bacterium]|nr:branched-chain amino acid ABC transporter permease [Rhodocyclaceae bacterium]
MSPPRRAALFEICVYAAAATLPFILQALGEEFYIGFATRMLIFALAATSLNFIVGYGGMVAFGHAAFFGGGAYVVALLMSAGIASAWVAWPVAILAAALVALVIGAFSLRTRGVYFIMITLAFAQMIYYSVVSLQSAGGDDGLPLDQRSTLAPFDLASDATLYWVTLALLGACLLMLKRISASRYGRALAGLRQNEARMEALGYPVFRLKLVCFVIGAAVAGLAGALLANQNGLASPTQLYWTQSGMLLVMVILGGVGRRFGGVLGAVALLGLEEILARFTGYSHFYVGLALLAVVLFAPHGLAGLIGLLLRKR